MDTGDNTQCSITGRNVTEVPFQDAELLSAGDTHKGDDPTLEFDKRHLAFGVVVVIC